MPLKSNKKEVNEKMEISIYRGGNRTFIISDVETSAFGLHIGIDTDIIKVFQWANKELVNFKKLLDFGGDFNV